jgi:ABC-type Mn2+/Zn2+ transport system permease subunit
MPVEVLLEPFKYEFFRNGSMAAILIGGLCGLMGVYIVLRGMSYIGHGLSHSIFGGAAVAYLMNWNFYIGAGTWGFLSAVLINRTVRRYRISADAAIGIITTASFAIGVAIKSRTHKFTQSFEATLFGSILGVTTSQVIGVALVALVIGIGVFLLYRRLLFTTFDTETARAYGINTEWMDTLFSLALAAAIIVSMQVIGATLIAAAIVIPPITARLMTDRFDHMLLISIGVGMVTALIGIYVSYFMDTSTGATIVLTQTVGFIAALTINSIRKRNRMAGVHYHV